VLLVDSSGASLPSYGWRRLAEGLEYRAVPLGSGSFPAMHQVRLDPRCYRLRLGLARDAGPPLGTVRGMRQRLGAVLAVNGGYFEDRGRPLGYLREAERLVVPDVATGAAFTGVLVVRPEGTRILHRDAFQPGPALLALQAGPRLVADGRPVAVLDSPPRRRTGVVRDTRGDLVLYATDPGGNLSMRACRDLLTGPAKAGGVQPVEALNLDGGSSTGISLVCGDFRLERPAWTWVPVTLAAVRRQTSSRSAASIGS